MPRPRHSGMVARGPSKAHKTRTRGGRCPDKGAHGSERGPCGQNWGSSWPEAGGLWGAQWQNASQRCEHAQA
eukprot:4003316-Alexandrium_andersonii.AAC.1